MSYASQVGRARTNPTSPQAHAICDRCGFRYNHVDLKWQMDWRGASIMNTRVLVCSDCYDTPQEQLRAIVVPNDPMPIINARVENFEVSEAGSATGNPYGNPTGLSAQGAIMPLNNGVAYGTVIPLLSVTASGSTTISVTCSAAHNLSTGSQISIEGLTQAGATGMFSVTVGGALNFFYTTASVIPAGSLLTAKSRATTALIGLPYGYATIPQIGA